MSDSRPLRQCLGRFATGVTVVTCRDDDGNAYGITANSFSSVSLEPPLVLWNIAKVSNSLRAFLQARHFAINVLSVEQQNLSAHFARSDHSLFSNIPHTLSADGAPVLPDSLATFECSTREIHDCGDHHIIIGEITGYTSTDHPPLLFFRGSYRRLAD